MNAADQRAALLRLAETEPDVSAAVTASLLGHARLPDPHNSAGWLCGCGLVPRLGQMHARHQADQVLALLKLRGDGGPVVWA